jgi:hypothetical protein
MPRESGQSGGRTCQVTRSHGDAAVARKSSPQAPPASITQDSEPSRPLQSGRRWWWKKRWVITGVIVPLIGVTVAPIAVNAIDHRATRPSDGQDRRPPSSTATPAPGTPAPAPSRPEFPTIENNNNNINRDESRPSIIIPAPPAVSPHISSPTSSVPAASPAPQVCAPADQTRVDGVPASTSVPSVEFTIVVNCSPLQPGNTYWWVTRFAYPTHSQWSAQATVSSVPGSYPTQYQPSGNSKGMTRYISVVSCTPDAARQLQVSSQRNTPIYPHLPPGCQAASSEVAMTFD